MNQAIESILFSEKEIQETVKKLGTQITHDYKDKDLLLIIILKGSLIFASDLARAIDLPVSIDFMQVSTYDSGTVSSGKLNIIKNCSDNIKNKDILIIEDIIDSGFTLSKLREYFENSEANSVAICTLLSKPERHVVDVKVEYTGMSIPDEFVVGYGLDFNQKYRNLPYIGILKRDIYE